MRDSTLPENVDARFWSKVAITPGCWLWLAYKDRAGYGRINVRQEDGQHRPEIASRIVWRLLRGPIPAGLEVLHNCPDGDNPACVNPNHLWLGTEPENQADKIAKGRQKPGGNFKLTPEQVAEARWLHQAGAGPRLLGRKYGINHGHMSRILRGLSW